MQSETKKLKAYKVNVKDADYSTIVFAESAGKAKALALSTDTCEDAEFVEIEVHRIPAADKMYADNFEMNWNNEKERLFLVKELNWACFEPSFECDECIAKQYCRWFESEVEAE